MPFNKDMKVLEIGSWTAPGQADIVCRRTIEPLVGEYVGLDMRPGPDVNVVSDAKCMPFADNEFHVILSSDCLEHVDWPRDVIREAYRVTKQGGLFYLTSVFDFEIHGYPDDYWRFTPNCIKQLLEDAGFKVLMYEGVGGVHSKRPCIVRGIGLKE
jgi:SAM-dependent methyltransferase